MNRTRARIHNVCSSTSTNGLLLKPPWLVSFQATIRLEPVKQEQYASWIATFLVSTTFTPGLTEAAFRCFTAKGPTHGNSASRYYVNATEKVFRRWTGAVAASSARSF